MHKSHSTWLRAEGLAVLLASLLIYSRLEEGWLLFAAVFLVPDLSMLGYLRGASVGAHFYNAVHTYTASLAMACLGIMLAHPMLIALAVIWTAHIGFDRALGYGLKQPTGFRDTHLGRIGREQIEQAV